MAPSNSPKLRYDMRMRRKDPIPPMPSFEEQMEAYRAESWRVFCEHQRSRNAIDQRPWFPWAVVGLGASLGAALVALAGWLKG
ncbi:hypothetical protein [Variovorax sp. WDL1]|uniref:hypothetical protein n=2 Tax=Variovorax TaxID=34072 RepID=UPI001E329D46|nr:hypothetical protein [Variovorax sp. WDL1]